jgi:hypothetical protein
MNPWLVHLFPSVDATGKLSIDLIAQMEATSRLGLVDSEEEAINKLKEHYVALGYRVTIHPTTRVRKRHKATRTLSL